MVQRVFIIPESCRFDGVQGMKSHFPLIAVMIDKHVLHIINEVKM